MCVVTGRLDNKDLGTVMQNIKRNLVTVILPSGYYIDYAGAYKDQQQSFKELLLILMACLLVFVFYYFYFEI
jgi:Cu/Ag efflux pump CusA